MTVSSPINSRVYGSDVFTNSSSEEGEFPFDSSTIFSKLSDSDIVYVRKEPKILGMYLFGEALGKGAYAKVKEAANINTRQKVAVKIINKKQLRKIPNGEENVRNEIEIHHKLDHRNIVKFFEAFTIPEKNKMFVSPSCSASLPLLFPSHSNAFSNRYIVLEHIGGGSVQDLLDEAPENRLPISQARW
jgi:serine/threonine-protein kinase 11